MKQEEINKIIQAIEAGLELKDDTVIFNVPLGKFTIYVRDNEYALSAKAQSMLFSVDKAYYEEYVDAHTLIEEAFKLMLEADESYFARYCWNNFFTFRQKGLIVGHKNALRWIELMMDNSGTETTQWLEQPEFDVPFVKLEGADADRVLKRYMEDNLPLSDEAQLALFEKKDAKKWVQYYAKVKWLSGKALDMAKDKGWI